jgi:hypothetical protein
MICAFALSFFLIAVGTDRGHISNPGLAGGLLFWVGLYLLFSWLRMKRKIRTLDYQARAIARELGKG